MYERLIPSAHMWLTIAGAHGMADTRETRDLLKRGMTRAEITCATDLARTCLSASTAAPAFAPFPALLVTH